MYVYPIRDTARPTLPPRSGEPACRRQVHLAIFTRTFFSEPFFADFASLALAFVVPARSKQSPSTTQSVTEAARNTRERIANSARHPKIITNDDLGIQYSLPSAASPLQSATTEAPTPPATGCDTPEAKRLKTELQATQEQLDQLRR